MLYGYLSAEIMLSFGLDRNTKGTLKYFQIRNLPMECLEIILVKAYVLYFHDLKQKDEKWLFSQLASISWFCLETIVRPGFKNFLHRHFMGK